MEFVVDGPHLASAQTCEPILRSLPGWFGIEAAILDYVNEIERLPTFQACQAGQALGFLTLKQHNPYAAEVYVMGVRPEAHRQGIGKALLGAAQAWLRQGGVEYLQVKTLGPSHSDENYARTRAFYAAQGFRPLEEFNHIWDEHNPCLVMVMKL